MKVLVTGAGGFIGAMLLQLLAEGGLGGGQSVAAIAAVDRMLPAAMPGVLKMEGDLRDESIHARIADFAPEVCFHLAALPGGAAEADPAGSRRVNLDATMDLFDLLGAIPCQHPRILVYASTIAVYGSKLPDLVTDTTPLRPPLIYGAHKLACEILLADYTRRGLLDGRALRLPGIVARPRTASGLASAFMSDLLHAVAAGEPFTCPVGPQATAWWMSARRCAENLIHAAVMDPGTDSRRAWPLPVLRLSMEEVVHTLSRMYRVDGAQLVRYEPQAMLEAVFGRYPMLDDQTSRALGLRDDGSAEELIRRALTH
ncbi:NAD-dependent epimerase/dehydratase family protein (plasmid) [Diaphorobacter sp. HDW4B]|uniref:NAD-dependent epimerase/dehydratase family protein n=1 Tax=Diaphorobacter sp. HDW4B TaxID=2714925 RepID=UPI00140C9865|nr:NAD-dependent epimerase/dehydratase family protein [Diaphorobacter sp. HDW4B]QIL74318.1 NAD-dependent epimerase/dehydratase family protein [Diaphorobacter sp. HDW4B]